MKYNEIGIQWLSVTVCMSNLISLFMYVRLITGPVLYTIDSQTVLQDSGSERFLFVFFLMG